MKTRFVSIGSIFGLAAGAALLCTAGCGKQEQQAGGGEPSKAASPAATETVNAATEAASQAVNTAKSEAKKTAETVVSNAQQVVSAVTTQASASVAESMSQVTALIEKAKGLVSDQKYKDALATVQQLSSMRLTPEQREVVDDLKAKIQAALVSTAGTNAASALGNILGGKK